MTLLKDSTPLPLAPKQSLPLSHISFACYFPATKKNLHENNQTLSSWGSLAPTDSLLSWVVFFCGLIMSPCAGDGREAAGMEPGC